MKAAFIIPCRNKERFVERAVQSVLDQTFAPMEIILSDQGSEDASLEIMRAVAATYHGPNPVRVLECPDTDPKGMHGLNAHLNWIHNQTDADVMILCSADDFNHPDRAAHVVKAFMKTNADYVGTAVNFVSPVGEMLGQTHYAGKDQWVTSIDTIKHTIGGACSAAWRRDFFLKHKTEGIESSDVVLPFFATLGNGFWYINELLHTYVRHADPENTGLEGVALAAKNDAEFLQVEELGHYHLASNFFALIRRCNEHKLTLPSAVEKEIIGRVVESSHNFVQRRDQLTMQRIPPRMMRA